jgi:hypothetical protein
VAARRAHLEARAGIEEWKKPVAEGNPYVFDLLLFWGIIAVASLALCVLMFSERAKAFFVEPIAWQTTIQFLFVVVIGGAVGVAYRRWEARRAEEKEQKERIRERKALKRASLEEFYRSCVEAHNGYKKVRRLLRASTAEEPPQINAEGGKLERSVERLTYDRLMNQLQDFQLKVESLYLHVFANTDLFDTERAAIMENLRKMEGYLRRVLRHYENEFSQVTDSKRVVLNEKLTEFIAHQKGNKTAAIATGLFDPADDVRRLVVKLIEKNTPADDGASH